MQKDAKKISINLSADNINEIVKNELTKKGLKCNIYGKDKVVILNEPNDTEKNNTALNELKDYLNQMGFEFDKKEIQDGIVLTFKSVDIQKPEEVDNSVNKIFVVRANGLDGITYEILYEPSEKVDLDTSKLSNDELQNIINKYFNNKENFGELKPSDLYVREINLNNYHQENQSPDKYGIPFKEAEQEEELPEATYLLSALGLEDNKIYVKVITGKIDDRKAHELVSKYFPGLLFSDKIEIHRLSNSEVGKQYIEKYPDPSELINKHNLLILKNPTTMEDIIGGDFTKADYYCIFASEKTPVIEIKNKIAEELSKAEFKTVYDRIKEKPVFEDSGIEEYNPYYFNTYFKVYDLDKNEKNKYFFKELKNEFLNIINDRYKDEVKKEENHGKVFAVVIKVPDKDSITPEKLQDIAEGIFPPVLFTKPEYEPITDFSAFDIITNEDELAKYIDEQRTKSDLAIAENSDGQEVEKEKEPTQQRTYHSIQELISNNGTIKGVRIAGLVDKIPNNAVSFSVEEYDRRDAHDRKVRTFVNHQEVPSEYRVTFFAGENYASETGVTTISSVIVDTNNGNIVDESIYDKSGSIKYRVAGDNQKIIEKEKNLHIVKPNVIRQMSIIEFGYNPVIDGKDVTNEINTILNSLDAVTKKKVFYINVEGIAPEEFDKEHPDKELKGETYKVWLGNVNNSRISKRFDIDLNTRELNGKPINKTEKPTEELKEVVANAKEIANEKIDEETNKQVKKLAKNAKAANPDLTNKEAKEQAEKKRQLVKQKVTEEVMNNGTRIKGNAQTKEEREQLGREQILSNISENDKRVLDDIYYEYKVRAVPAEKYKEYINAINDRGIINVSNEIKYVFLKAVTKTGKENPNNYVRRYILFDATGNLIGSLYYSDDFNKAMLVHGGIKDIFKDFLSESKSRLDEEENDELSQEYYRFDKMISEAAKSKNRVRLNLIRGAIRKNEILSEEEKNLLTEAVNEVKL